MNFFKISRDIPFMRHAKLLNAISFLTFVAAVVFIALRGLAFSIEFTGGTVIEVAYPQAAPINEVRTTVQGLGYADAQVQNFGSSRELMIRLPLDAERSKAQAEEVFKAIQPLGGGGAELRRVEFVGPQVGSELAVDGEHAVVTREVDGGLQTIRVRMPTIITVDLRLNEPRYASLPNIMKAKKKPLDEKTSADYGVDVTPRLTVVKTVEPQGRKAGVKVASVAELIAKLKDEAGVI
jgi:hypothetical protein